MWVVLPGPRAGRRGAGTGPAIHGPPEQVPHSVPAESQLPLLLSQFILLALLLGGGSYRPSILAAPLPADELVNSFLV